MIDASVDVFEFYGLAAGSEGTITIVGTDGNTYVTNIVLYSWLVVDGLVAFTFNPIAGTVSGRLSLVQARYSLMLLGCWNGPLSLISRLVGIQLSEEEDNLSTLVANANTVRARLTPFRVTYERTGYSITRTVYLLWPTVSTSTFVRSYTDCTNKHSRCPVLCRQCVQERGKR